jgi:hypothetical protein
MAEQHDGRRWWPWDTWLAHHGFSAAYWPTPADHAGQVLDYQRLAASPPRPRPTQREPLDREAEAELLRRLLEG